MTQPSILKLMTSVAAVLALSACAQKELPPKISYDPGAFEVAIQTPEPPRPVEIVTIPEPLPLPGQLKPLPERTSSKSGKAVSEDPHEDAPEDFQELVSGDLQELVPFVEYRVWEANEAAKVEPAKDGYINAIQVYPYSDGALYQLYTAPEQVSDIALQPSEQIVAVSAGDTVRWVIGDVVSGSGANARAHILVKPTTENLATNLVIITDRRAYHLELISTYDTYMAAISWRYPQDELFALQRRNGIAETAAQQVVDRGIALDKLRFRYEISGDNPPWRPVRVFDDTNKVYIQFPARLDQGEAPPLFVVGPSGEAQLVNYRVNGRTYIVDRMFAAAELRLGESPQQIVRITRTDTWSGGHPSVLFGDQSGSSGLSQADPLKREYR